jgi:hypothetical protein
MVGFKTAKIMKFSGLHTNNVEMKFLIKSGGFIGPYGIKGKLLKMNIEGRGDLKVSFSKFKSNISK